MLITRDALVSSCGTPGGCKALCNVWRYSDSGRDKSFLQLCISEQVKVGGASSAGQFVESRTQLRNTTAGFQTICRRRQT